MCTSTPKVKPQATPAPSVSAPSNPVEADVGTDSINQITNKKKRGKASLVISGGSPSSGSSLNI